MASGGAATQAATSAMPGLPGVHTTSAVRARASASAWSRAPLPTTQTLTPFSGPRPRVAALAARGSRGSRREGDDLVAAGAQTDEADRYPDPVGEEIDVVAASAGSASRRVTPEMSHCQPGSSS